METMMKNLEKNDMMVGVNAIIFNSRNELLLAKRKNCLGDGLYSLVGGHLKKGESIEECIIRELFEEIGIIVDINDVEVVNFASTLVTTGIFASNTSIFSKNSLNSLLAFSIFFE